MEPKKLLSRETSANMSADNIGHSTTKAESNVSQRNGMICAKGYCANKGKYGNDKDPATTNPDATKDENVSSNWN